MKVVDMDIIQLFSSYDSLEILKLVLHLKEHYITIYKIRNKKKCLVFLIL